MSKHLSGRHDRLRRGILWIFIVSLTILSRLAAAASPAGSSANQDRTLDLVVRSEVTIGRPVKEVWKHFLNMDAWMEDIRFQRIEGTSGEQGEVRRGTAREPDAYGAFIVEAVRVVACVQYVLKVTPEQGNDYLGFADFSFSEADGRTHLIYDLYMQLTVRGISEQEFQKFSKDQYAGSRQGMARNNHNLKALAEGVR